MCIRDRSIFGALKPLDKLIEILLKLLVIWESPILVVIAEFVKFKSSNCLKKLYKLLSIKKFLSHEADMSTKEYLVPILKLVCELIFFLNSKYAAIEPYSLPSLGYLLKPLL